MFEASLLYRRGTAQPDLASLPGVARLGRLGGVTGDLSPAGGRLTAQGLAITLEAVPGRDEAAVAATSARRALGWRDAAEAVKGHDARIALTVRLPEGAALPGAEAAKAAGAQPDLVVRRAEAWLGTLLGAALSDLLAEADTGHGAEPIAFWRAGPTSVLSPPQLDRDLANIARGIWPVECWLGLALLREGTGQGARLGLRTIEAAPMIGFEMSLEPGRPADLKARIPSFIGAASRMLDTLAGPTGAADPPPTGAAARLEGEILNGEDGGPAVLRLTDRI